MSSMNFCFGLEPPPALPPRYRLWPSASQRSNLFPPRPRVTQCWLARLCWRLAHGRH